MAHLSLDLFIAPGSPFCEDLYFDHQMFEYSFEVLFLEPREGTMFSVCFLCVSDSGGEYVFSKFFMKIRFPDNLIFTQRQGYNLNPHHKGAAAEGGGPLVVCILMWWHGVGMPQPGLLLGRPKGKDY